MNEGENSDPIFISYCLEKKVYMNIRLRWRNGIVSGDYEFQYYIGMDK
jgi:hypothetical protein